MKISLSNVIFGCCSYHETKAMKQGKERGAKKEGRKKRKEKNKRERDIYIYREREEREKRERERVKRGSERSKGERKGETEKLTKIPFFRAKAVFYKKKQKRHKKGGLGTKCPTTRVQGYVDPKPKKKAQKRGKTPKQKEGVWRGPLQICENGAETKPRKRRKNPPHRSRKAVFDNDPNSDRRRDTPARPERLKFARAPEKMRKNALFKTSSVLQPQRFFFFTLETQLRLNLELRKIQIVTRQKIILKKGLQSRALSRRSSRSRRGRKTQIRSETPT